MIKRTLYITLFSALCGAVAACGDSKGNDYTPAPLPVTYPRLPITVGDTMIAVPNLPVACYVNPLAEYTVNEVEPPELTVNYPTVGANVYFTFIPVTTEEQREAVIEARLQRIGLNLSGTPAKTLHGEAPDGSVATVVVAKSMCQTPVQLLVDMPEYVVTATAFLRDGKPTWVYDSIAPLINVLEHDLCNSLPGFIFD